MANVTLWGASYSDVPAVTLPQTGGGTVTFYENGGGGGLEEKEVNFYDYDGTLLHAYTAEEFLALSALPSNPTHEGLTAQGWNWTLAEAQTYSGLYPNARVNIGQMYTTESGATEIDVVLDSMTLSPYLSVAPNGTISIDWGDNSTPDSVTGTSLTSEKWTLHNYAEPGNYTIKISASSGTYALYSNRTGNEVTLIQYTNSYQNARLYSSAVRSIRVGADVPSVGNLNNLINLEVITIPNTVTSLGRFINDYSLQAVIVPKGITSVGACQTLTSVKCFSVPCGITSIPSDFMKGNRNLKYFTIPSTVDTISNYAFQSSGVVEMTIPSNVTSMGVAIFHSCSALKWVAVKCSNVDIGGDFCRECYALEDIEFPSGAQSLAGFYNCTSLQKITIPSTVTTIGAGCFQSNYSLTEIHVLPTTPPTLVNNVSFYGMPINAVFYVPAESLSDYQSASNWSNFASQMQGV